MPWKRQGRTEIVHIVVTGYQKRKLPSKHYVFAIDVTWNNNDRFEVYRRYSDFFSFQTTLKALFPAAAGRKNEERVIPQLPKRKFVGRSHVAKVAEARLEQINRYTQTLISLDPNISESAHVVGFFSPRGGDKELPKLHLHRPVSLHPAKMPLGDVFEEYCALAEYVAEDKTQITFKPGDKVLVMSKDKSGWWMCNVNGEVGWGPPSYLKKCSEIIETEDSDQSEDEAADQKAKDSDDSGVGENTTSARSLPSSSITSYSTESSISSLTLPSLTSFQTPEIEAEEYKAIDSYQADGPGQISFEAGETIHVLDKLEDGWWFVSNGKDEGWAPCSYLEGDKDEEGITNLDNAEKYYSVDNYVAEEDDEISFKRGAVVDVLQKSLDGWWMIKVNKQVGLAPATFLKKLENPEDVPKNDEVQKVTPASPIQQQQQLQQQQQRQQEQQLPVMKAFQQPPRKASVRAKASMRINPAAIKKTPLSKTTSSPLASVPASNPYRNIEFSSLRSENLPTIVSKSVSPDISDSDPEDNYLNVPFHNLPIKQRTASQGNNLARTGEGKSKRPVALPRNNKKLSSQSFSVSKSGTGGSGGFRPPLPPKPNEAPAIPEREKAPLYKYNSLDSVLDPQRPAQRPRGSEIRRAKNRARTDQPRAKGTPELSVVDEDGLETASIYSGKSMASNISSKSAPARGGQKGGEKFKKKRAQSAQEEVTVVRKTKTTSTQLLVPERPPRPRRKSEGEDAIQPPHFPSKLSSSSSVPGEEMETDGLNANVANTLLRYIISSEDQTLKDALRDLIKQDSKAVTSLSDQ